MPFCAAAPSARRCRLCNACGGVSTAREEDPAPTDAAEATGLLINRLLHATSEALRRNAAGGALEAGTRRLFRLDLDEDSEDKEKPE